MIFGLIFGQGLWFGIARVPEYGLVVFAGFYLFGLLYEEPALRGKFGHEYEEASPERATLAAANESP